MSAYVVDIDHIAYLVEAGRWRNSSLSWVWDVNRQANTYKREQLSYSDDVQNARVGQMLWDENIKSVSHRYPEDTRETLPGPIDCDYVYNTQAQARFFGNLDMCQILSACDCYEYQTCEHDEWPESEAKAYIDALRKRAYSALPGYDKAEWGAPLREEVARERLRIAGKGGDT